MISAALAILKSEAQRNEMSAIYEKYKKRLQNIALKILQSEEEAEDAVQDAFLKIADKPDTFFSLDDKNRILYMCVVVKNASIDKYNKIKKVLLEPLGENLIYQNDTEPLVNTMFK